MSSRRQRNIPLGCRYRQVSQPSKWYHESAVVVQRQPSVGIGTNLRTMQIRLPVLDTLNGWMVNQSIHRPINQSMCWSVEHNFTYMIVHHQACQATTRATFGSSYRNRLTNPCHVDVTGGQGVRQTNRLLHSLNVAPNIYCGCLGCSGSYVCCNALWVHVTGGNSYPFQRPLTVPILQPSLQPNCLRWGCARRMWKCLADQWS